jgi:hypothetical protein
LHANYYVEKLDMRNPWQSASFQFPEFDHQPYINFLCPSLPVSPLLNRHDEFSPRNIELEFCTPVVLFLGSVCKKVTVNMIRGTW